MGQVVLSLTSFGVEQNLKTKLYRIYFLSDTLKLYLGEDIITENPTKALETEDISFAFEELYNVMQDDEFLTHLKACIALGGD